MAKSNDFENSLLLAVFNNSITSFLANLGSGLVASTSAGNLKVALLKSGNVPDDTINSTFVNANEADYGGYQRIDVARTTGGWTVSGGSVSNTADITFDAATSGSNTLEYAVVIDSAGTVTGYYGTLSAPITVTTGITPQIDAGDLIITED